MESLDTFGRDIRAAPSPHIINQHGQRSVPLQGHRIFPIGDEGRRWSAYLQRTPWFTPLANQQYSDDASSFFQLANGTQAMRATMDMYERPFTERHASRTEGT
jgi:hypothetical protein